MNERQLSSAQPMNDLTQQDVARPRGRAEAIRISDAGMRTIYQPPRTIPAIFAIVTRADAALVMAMPVVGAVLLAWWETGRFDGLALFFTLLGVIATALGMHALVEYYDFRRSVIEPESTRDAFLSGALLIAQGRLAPTTARNLGFMLVLIGLLCGVWLSLLAGWPMLFFTGLGLLLALTYAMPPIRYVARGWALGEVGLFTAFGLLSMVGSYYVQAHALTSTLIWTTVPFGLLVVLASLTFNLMHYRRDWLIRKRTLVVELRLQRALDVSVVLLVVAFAAFLPIVTLARLPLVTLIVLAALPLPLGVVGRIRRDHVTADDCLPYYSAILGSSALTTLLFAVALWADNLF